MATTSHVRLSHVDGHLPSTNSCCSVCSHEHTLRFMPLVCDLTVMCFFVCLCVWSWMLFLEHRSRTPTWRVVSSPMRTQP